MTSKGLVIDQQWIDKILSGEKTWEMRSRSTKVRGEIALIAKGTGTILGFAHLVDCLPALAPHEMASHFSKHRIPDEMIAREGFKWFTPWVLSHIRRADRPIPYAHPSGAVTWVNLPVGRERTYSEVSSKLAGHQAIRAVPVTADEEWSAKSVVRQIEHDHGLMIPGNTPVSVRRDGNKLHIDVEWDEPEENRQAKLSRWRATIGDFGVATSCICACGLMLHLPLAVIFEYFTFFGALKWVPPMFVAMLLAAIGGRGDELSEIFGGQN